MTSSWKSDTNIWEKLYNYTKAIGNINLSVQNISKGTEEKFSFLCMAYKLMLTQLQCQYWPSCTCHCAGLTASNQGKSPSFGQVTLLFLILKYLKQLILFKIEIRCHQIDYSPPNIAC